MKRAFLTIFSVLLFAGLIAVVINNYSFIFSKDVAGEILEVERVSQPNFIGGNVPSNQVFSFAVAIKTKSGEIFTASSEDRQWAVARKGMCIESKFYPYPPWQLDKANTYSNARLIRLVECPPTAAATATPTQDSAPAPSVEPTPILPADIAPSPAD